MGLFNLCLRETGEVAVPLKCLRFKLLVVLQRKWIGVSLTIRTTTRSSRHIISLKELGGSLVYFYNEELVHKKRYLVALRTLRSYCDNYVHKFASAITANLHLLKKLYYNRILILEAMFTQNRINILVSS